LNKKIPHFWGLTAVFFRCIFAVLFYFNITTIFSIKTLNLFFIAISTVLYHKCQINEWTKQKASLNTSKRFFKSNFMYTIIFVRYLSVFLLFFILKRNFAVTPNDRTKKQQIFIEKMFPFLLERIHAF
jgi:hypothetical protein